MYNKKAPHKLTDMHCYTGLQRCLRIILNISPLNIIIYHLPCNTSSLFFTTGTSIFVCMVAVAAAVAVVVVVVVVVVCVYVSVVCDLSIQNIHISLILHPCRKDTRHSMATKGDPDLHHRYPMLGLPWVYVRARACACMRVRVHGPDSKEDPEDDRDSPGSGWVSVCSAPPPPIPYEVGCHKEVTVDVWDQYSGMTHVMSPHPPPTLQILINNNQT